MEENINNLEYPNDIVWYITIRGGEVETFGILESPLVLSTTADIDVYESRDEWVDQLVSLGYSPNDL